MTALEIVGGIVWVGVGATLVSDVWAIAQRRLFRWQTLDYALVGRWIGHMRAGRLAHENIRAASPVPAERTIGWIAHYLIGVSFAAALVVLFGPGWLAQPTLLPALAVGLGSVAAPFLLMQPCFGMGIAASRAPNPTLARTRGVLTHLVFGLGMYASALLFAAMTQPAPLFRS
ncbi:MAG TPA: DUF2938 domain-containing protein [Hyphomonadaceae bacterium]|nr:DUF2938 domain-containing protein [Hyphomonadaceae bacterium]